LITNVNEKNSEAADNAEKHRERGSHSTAWRRYQRLRSGRRRPRGGQTMALVSRSGPFAALSSLRLAFALRHPPRLGRTPPVTILPSFVLAFV